MSLKDLKGLGPKTEKQLNDIGIYTKADLTQIGSIKAFIKLSNDSDIKPSLNFLYAMAGAIEDKHWREIAKNDKGRLLIELEEMIEIEKSFENK